MNITSNSEQAENTESAERQKKLVFQKNRWKVQTRISLY